ncbi:MAG: autotransporter outer membrane beta-barrel domain-containing protein [Chlamydiae bacterium]|nr:autotransporter outer membrane beta-barrel domain-containing protein [Chlamydiota bacterium]
MKIRIELLALSLLAVCETTSLHADSSLGLIGGYEILDPISTIPSGYAAFVDENGSLTPLSTLPSTVIIGGLFFFTPHDVSINTSGIGLIGGADISSGTNYYAYAALVGPGSTVTPITVTLTGVNTYIYSTAINNSAIGLIGGGPLVLFGGAGSIYAAIVGPGATITPLNLSGANGAIFGTAINKSGTGLIGGQISDAPFTGTGAAYAALVGPGNNVTPLTLGVPNGYILSVSINDDGIGLIGGYDEGLAPGNNQAYAAFVKPDSTVDPITLSLVGGAIYDVAINQTGAGIIGGQDASRNAYAAVVLSGSSTPIVLQGLPTSSSIILGVAINNTGTGLIAGVGQGGTPAYAAFVSPTGAVTTIQLNVTTGQLCSAAINEAGVGFVGGSNNGNLYAALVAPNGAVTPLVLSNIEGNIASVAFPPSPLNAPVPNAVVPKSIGSNWAAFNTQLAAIYSLNTHMKSRHRSSRKSVYSAKKTSAHKGKESGGLDFLVYEDETQERYLVAYEHEDFLSLGEDPSKEDLTQEPHLLVYQGDDFLSLQYDLSPDKQREKIEDKAPNGSNLWVAPFGNYVTQKSQGSNPSNTSSIGGFLLGYDYSYSDLLFGASAGYGYNYVSYGSGIHGSIQEEMANIYGAYEHEYFSMNFAVWGGLYQLYNKRNTLFIATSTANTHGWILSPHFEVATPFEIGNKETFFLEPFVMFDYVNNWQHKFTEKGVSGLNLVMKNHYSSLLRSEAGLRFFEEWRLSKGTFLFEQKLSYVNQTPFDTNSVTTSFVASASSFPIAIGSSAMQNLGGAEVSISFVPRSKKYPYITVDCQAELGSSYQSYFGNLEIGKTF